MSVFRETKVAGLRTDDFVSKQVFYTSKDGTRIPMFITHHKDFKQDGTAPAIQYGYVSHLSLGVLLFFFSFGELSCAIGFINLFR